MAATLEFSISPQAAYKAIIQPAFSDLTPAGFPFQGSLNEFTSAGYDDVMTKRTIVDLRRIGNISHRRDASCDYIYNKVMNATTRFVEVAEAYAATRLCLNAFYQGALKDLRNGDPLFRKNVTPFFQSAINQDLATNGYFGNIRRVVPSTALYSTNIFNGVFNWIKFYIGAGIIATSGANQQANTIADGTDYNATGGPQAAFDLLTLMYNQQNLLMYNMMDSDKAFYVSKEIKKALEKYYQNVSLQALGYTVLANGIKQLTFEGIPVLEEPIWTSVITEIKGAKGYAAVLTLRSNFIFAFNKNYGGGPNLDQGLQIFYDDLTDQWYWRYYYSAGTQVALPEHLIVAMSAWT